MNPHGLRAWTCQARHAAGGEAGGGHGPALRGGYHNLEIPSEVLLEVYNILGISIFCKSV